MERVKIMLEENLGGNCHIHPRERDESNFLKSHNLLCVAGAMMEERCAGDGRIADRSRFASRGEFVKGRRGGIGRVTIFSQFTLDL